MATYDYYCPNEMVTYYNLLVRLGELAEKSTKRTNTRECMGMTDPLNCRNMTSGSPSPINKDTASCTWTGLPEHLIDVRQLVSTASMAELERDR